MGCCGSTDRASSSSQKHQSRSESTHESRAPPPSAEEETVKEVLSVTPKPPPPPPTPTANIVNSPKEEEDECKKNWVEPILIDKIKESNGFKVEQGLQEEVSEVSEICSLGLSESVTSAISDKIDNEDEVRQRVVRSPAKFAPRNGYSGELVPKRELAVRRSFTRRSEHSPAKRNGAIGGGSVRMVHSREVGKFARGRSRPEPCRRDPGESSGRRAPLSAASGSTTRKANLSPGRARLDHTGNGGRKAEDNSVDGNKWPSSTNTNSAATADESLENPLVSLECFIFL